MLNDTNKIKMSLLKSILFGPFSWLDAIYPTQCKYYIGKYIAPDWQLITGFSGVWVIPFSWDFKAIWIHEHAFYIYYNNALKFAEHIPNLINLKLGWP